MKIETTMIKDIAVVALRGELDYSSSEEMRQPLMEIVDNNRNVVIDMEKCTYVSSSGLRVLLLLGKRSKQLGENIALANLTEDVRDIMEMTGFGTIFNCYDNLETATASMA
ncbi:MAG: STAS domain-containing protein [Ruminococcus sp.]|nr:STAS domain-containing protein [Ruminococcus sp.]